MIVSIVKVLRQYPLLRVLQGERKYIQPTCTRSMSWRSLDKQHPDSQKRRRSVGVWSARRRVAHGYRFQLVSVLLYVDR